VVRGITRYPEGEQGVGHSEVFHNLWLVTGGDDGRLSEFIEYWMLVEKGAGDQFAGGRSPARHTPCATRRFMFAGHVVQ
jgi:hypothetical protein